MKTVFAMLNIDIICVGGLKERYFSDACDEYLKRLRYWAKVKITEIPEKKLPRSPSQAEIDKGLIDAGVQVLKIIPAGAFVVALCIEGKLMSSAELSEKIESVMETGGNAVFIIGGSFGLSPDVKALADLKLSMSPMTFPHNLARVMLLEQLYRAMSILNNGKYNK